MARRIATPDLSDPTVQGGAGFTGDELAMATRGLLRIAGEAREDMSKFYDLVIKHELTKAALQTAPHQKVVFSFFEAHPWCVLRLPISTGKTFSVSAITLWLLGRDPTQRGAIVSAAQSQSKKVLAMVSDYITEPELQHSLALVFPGMQQSPRGQDAWTQTEITIDRPPGIRDPSLKAIGLDGKMGGARLSWLVTDDAVDDQNTNTPEARAQVQSAFDSRLVSRLDPLGSRAVVTNTPWHRSDLTYHLENDAGWATLTMDIYGFVRFSNADPEWIKHAEENLLRPSETRVGGAFNWYRLRANDPDPKEEIPLWPERFSADRIHEIRYGKGGKGGMLPHEFARLFLCEPMADDAARCQRAWIEKCKLRGRGLTMVQEYNGDSLTFTGIDLAVGKTRKHDKTTFFTFELMEDGSRKILDVDSGRYDGPAIVKKLIDKADRYKSLITVETNSCLVPGTNVLTKQNGYVPIEKIEEGDLVWTHRGRWKKVLEKIQGTARAITPFKVRGSVGLRMTPNHWVYLRKRGRVPGREGGHHIPHGDPQWVSCGFVDHDSYASISVPSWEPCDPVLEFDSTSRQPGGTIKIDHDMAVVLGLYLAEGHSTESQVSWTTSGNDKYLSDFIVDTMMKRIPWIRVSNSKARNTYRTTISHRGLAKLFSSFGKAGDKGLPASTMGWPLEIRMAIVRGWLLGDGYLGRKNGKNRFFSGTTISRNLLMWLRSTLLQSDVRATVSIDSSRKTSVIEGRTVNKRPIYTLRIPSHESIKLSEKMCLEIERLRWGPLPIEDVLTKDAGASVVFDNLGAWSFVQSRPCEFEEYNDTVYNLVVEDDESYTAEDVVVHNAQEYLRQFAIAENRSIPIRAHHTNRANKMDLDFGVESLFTEIQAEAWIIPSDDHGNCHKEIQTWIEDMIFYQPPPAHTGDRLMASWIARESARKRGRKDPPPRVGRKRSMAQQRAF